MERNIELNIIPQNRTVNGIRRFYTTQKSIIARLETCCNGEIKNVIETTLTLNISFMKAILDEIYILYIGKK